jgi:hypothetical protein
MSSRKKILIICDSDLSREPRVIRQIIALKDSYDLFTAGSKETDFVDIKHFNLLHEYSAVPGHWHYPFPLRKAVSFSLNLYQRFRKFYPRFYYEKEFWTRRRKEIVDRLKAHHFDVIISHHWDSLPLAYEIGKMQGAKLIFNAHDYYPRQFEDSEGWVTHIKPLVDYTMAKYLPHFDLIYSAWTKIHEDFQKIYKVRSIIINNATEFNELKPVVRVKNDGMIRLVHHGIANPNRQLEKMIKMMDVLDERFTLDFILVCSPAHQDYLESLKQLANKSERIKFLEPVPTRDIARSINKYDIGLFLLPPNGFNPTYLLPNKLFEYIQARLACLISPSIEMKNIVEKYELGWVSKDFTPHSLANEIKDVTPQMIDEKKSNADRFAFELSAEKNYQRIQQSIEELMINTTNKSKKTAVV